MNSEPRAATRVYVARFYRGPLDGGEELIECGYPPKEHRGYQISHSVVGRYYVYIWPKPQ